MRRIVVAGIGTEVGKTVVSAILAEAMEGCYWKPVQCGLPRDRDWATLKTRAYPEHFCFQTPCSPHLAAKKEGVRIEAKDLIPPPCNAILIIEGTGGLFAPLNETESWIDAAIHWNALWVLVHRHYLGSLNHFLLSIEAMQKRKIPLLGVVFNGEADPETEEMLLKRADTRCLGRLACQELLTKTRIREIAEQWKPQLLQALGH